MLGNCKLMKLVSQNFDLPLLLSENDISISIKDFSSAMKTLLFRLVKFEVSRIHDNI